MMNTIQHPKQLIELAEYEKSIRDIAVDMDVKVQAGISMNGYLVFKYKDIDFAARLDRNIKHQLGARIWGNINYNTILENWDQLNRVDPDKLLRSIETVFQHNQMIIRYIPDVGFNMIYGIVTPYYQPIDQIWFREQLLKEINKYDCISYDNDCIVSKHGGIYEQFLFHPDGRETTLKLIMKHGRNNGYSGYKFHWGRKINICSNGLLDVSSGVTSEIAHKKSVDAEKLLYKILAENITIQEHLKQYIQRSRETKLDNQTLASFFNRLHTANATKDRVYHSLKKEVNKEGKNEWALSQALTFIGSHDRYTPNLSKYRLKKAGTKILEQGLQNYLCNPESVSTDAENYYNELLPVRF